MLRQASYRELSFSYLRKTFLTTYFSHQWWYDPFLVIYLLYAVIYVFFFIIIFIYILTLQ